MFTSIRKIIHALVMSRLAPYREFEAIPMIQNLKEIRAKSREVVKEKFGVETRERPTEGGKTTEMFMVGDLRLYPLEETVTRDGRLLVTFRFDDITRPQGKGYASCFATFDCDGNCVETGSCL